MQNPRDHPDGDGDSDEREDQYGEFWSDGNYVIYDKENGDAWVQTDRPIDLEKLDPSDET